MVSILFFIKRKKLLKDGTASIFVRVTFNRLSAEVTTGRSVMPSHWVATKGRAKGNTLVNKQHIYITDYQRLFILIGTTSVLTNTKNVWTNANHCISWFCIYVLYRLFSALLWNVRYQIQCIG